MELMKELIMELTPFIYLFIYLSVLENSWMSLKEQKLGL